MRKELEARGAGQVAEPPEGSKPSEYERPMYPPALGAPPLNGDSGESLRVPVPFKRVMKMLILILRTITLPTPRRSTRSRGA